MTEYNKLSPIFLDIIPDDIEGGKLYISLKYEIALHLCCCGCGLEVATPLGPADWRIKNEEGRVSLYPSIGNVDFPCNSHYWIEENKVKWTKGLTAVQAKIARDRDTEGRIRHYAPRKSILRRIWDWLFG